MQPKVISTYQDLQALAGVVLPAGRWQTITRHQARGFKETCVGGPLALPLDLSESAKDPHFASGHFLLSLLGTLRSTVEAVCFSYDSRMNVYYGLDDVRFHAPLPLPSQIRLNLTVIDAKMLDQSVMRVVYGHRLETQELETVLTANVINRIYLNESI